MLYKHQKRTLTFESAEEIASQIFIKKKYLKNKKNYCRVQIVDNQSFFEDIDDEKDLKLLDNN